MFFFNVGETIVIKLLLVLAFMSCMVFCFLICVTGRIFMRAVLFWQRRAQGFFLCAKAKRDLALHRLAALPLKNKQNLPAIQATCLQELHL